jgi:hypothetical protein
VWSVSNPRQSSRFTFPMPRYNFPAASRPHRASNPQTDAEMSLIDMDQADPFDFYLDRYQAQLSAGYIKITPNFGLRVYMKDLNKLPRSAAQKKSPVKKD